MAAQYVSDLDLAGKFGVSRATIWRWKAADPSFPRPVRLSPGCVRWRLTEVEAWEKARPVAA